MSHPDKKLSFFNDATFGVAPRFDDLNSYAKRLNIEFVIMDDGLYQTKNI